MKRAWLIASFFVFGASAAFAAEKLTLKEAELLIESKHPSERGDREEEECKKDGSVWGRFYNNEGSPLSPYECRTKEEAAQSEARKKADMAKCKEQDKKWVKFYQGERNVAPEACKTKEEMEANEARKKADMAKCEENGGQWSTLYIGPRVKDYLDICHIDERTRQQRTNLKAELPERQKESACQAEGKRWSRPYRGEGKVPGPWECMGVKEAVDNDARQRIDSEQCAKKGGNWGFLYVGEGVESSIACTFKEDAIVSDARRKIDADACAKKGGQWRMRAAFTHEPDKCVMPIPAARTMTELDMKIQKRRECEQQGKYLTPFYNGEGYVSGSEECRTKEEVDVDRARRAADAARCRQKEGRWGVFEKGGGFNTYECLLPYKDGGKPCRSKTECLSDYCGVDYKSADQGVCLAFPLRGYMPPAPFDRDDPSLSNPPMMVW